MHTKAFLHFLHCVQAKMNWRTFLRSTWKLGSFWRGWSRRCRLIHCKGWILAHHCGRPIENPHRDTCGSTQCDEEDGSDWLLVENQPTSGNFVIKNFSVSACLAFYGLINLHQQTSMSCKALFVDVRPATSTSDCGTFTVIVNDRWHRFFFCMTISLCYQLIENTKNIIHSFTFFPYFEPQDAQNLNIWFQ